MKKFLVTAILLSSLISTSTVFAVPLSDFNIAGLQNIEFLALGSFSFLDAGSNDYDDFIITSQTGGAGTLVNGPGFLDNLTGDLDGSFTFADPGSASSVAVTTSPGATFEIFDGTAAFSAPITLFTLSELGGPFGGILGTISFNLSSYGGTNADLLQLASSPSGNVSVTFQLASGTLDLKKIYDNGLSTSWSGSVQVTPEPTSLLLLGSGLAALGLRLRKKASKA